MKKRILIIYYSFTQQTRLLVKKFAAGLEQEGSEVVLERLEPLAPYEFPFKSDFRLATVMIRTFFRERTRIKELSEVCYQDWDLVVLAGPTWSYHPSGPVLDFLARFGAKVCGEKQVLILISARSYWRLHYWSLKRSLGKIGAKLLPPLVYEHPVKEPFRFIGLVLQLRGKTIRRAWFRKRYPGYGNSKEQRQDAFDKGVTVGERFRLEE